ncbi:hypothetical protein ACFQU7_32660 [Pseudoroseomonas wenyumeiae]
MPPAPARFSITSGWPSSCDMRGVTRRVMISVLVPAPKGTITRIGRSGQLPCEKAARGSAGSASPAAAADRKRRRVPAGVLAMMVPPMIAR